MSKPKLLNVEDFSLEEMKQLVEGAKKYISPPEYVVGEEIDYGRTKRTGDNTPDKNN